MGQAHDECAALIDVCRNDGIWQKYIDLAKLHAINQPLCQYSVMTNAALVHIDAYAALLWNLKSEFAQ